MCLFCIGIVAECGLCMCLFCFRLCSSANASAALAVAYLCTVAQCGKTCKTGLAECVSINQKWNCTSLVLTFFFIVCRCSIAFNKHSIQQSHDAETLIEPKLKFSRPLAKRPTACRTTSVKSAFPALDFSSALAFPWLFAWLFAWFCETGRRFVAWPL